MAALIVWRRRQPGEADGITDDVQLSAEPQLLDDELAA